MSFLPRLREACRGAERGPAEALGGEDDLARRYCRKLRAGDSIFITGQLCGGGGVIATEIHSGPPP